MGACRRPGCGHWPMTHQCFRCGAPCECQGDLYLVPPDCLHRLTPECDPEAAVQREPAKPADVLLNSDEWDAFVE